MNRLTAHGRHPWLVKDTRLLRKLIGASTIAAVWLACSPAALAQAVNDLLPLVPRDVNSLSVLRVEALTHSPRGEQEGWAARHESEHLDGSLTIPPWVTVILRSSYLQPGRRGSDWTVALLPAPEEFDLADLAAREETEIQEIEGHRVVLSPRRNGYFVEWPDRGDSKLRILGGMSPAARQDVARWIVESGPASSAVGLSPYLVEATRDEAAQLVWAVDMQHMLDPVQIRYRLDGSDALKDHPSAKPGLTIALQSLRGFRLAVHVKEQIDCEFRLDFNRNLGMESAFIKPALVELLEDMGASLDELADAKVSAQGRSFTLRSPLSDESLRRLLSLFTTPPPSHGAGRAADQPPDPQPSRQPELTATRRYYRAVCRNIDDLQQAYRRAKSYDKTARWHLSFAQRIDDLPTSRVHPAGLAFGTAVSDKLRGLAASLNGTAVKIRELDRTIVYDVEVTPVYRTGFDWWWGGAMTASGPYTYGQPTQTTVNTNLNDVRQQQAGVVADTAPERQEIWKLIEADRAQAEAALVQEFGREFLN